MKNYRNALIVLLLIFSLLGLEIAAVNARPLPRFGVGLQYQSYDPDGTLQVSGATKGDQVDVNSQLNLGSDASPELVGWIRFNKFLGTRLSYGQFSYTGSNTLNESIRYNDESFNASERIQSDFDFDLGDLDLFYEFLTLNQGGFVNGHLGVRYFGFDGTIQTSSGTKESSDSFSGAAPVAGVRIRKYIFPRFFAQANLSGLDVELNEGQFGITDVRLALGYRLTDRFRSKVGYRDFTIDGTHTGDQGEDSLDMGFSGFNLTAVVLF
jgi:hypothetical protein